MEPKEKMARYVVEPKEVPKQLTDNDGLDRAYAPANCVSIIDNTLHIAGTKVGGASDWYDDITKVPTLWNAVSYSKSMQVLYVWNESSSLCRRFSKASKYNYSSRFYGSKGSSTTRA